MRKRNRENGRNRIKEGKIVELKEEDKKKVEKGGVELDKGGLGLERSGKEYCGDWEGARGDGPLFPSFYLDGTHRWFVQHATERCL
ncbi:unnamed protein product [Citrullus colocynthis]|uniref:Uncharacterized protein n=1 Tax=Citrullus colocynthis TaxID=252529 RepID=A0ABP0XXC3_9ROSI